MGCVLFEMLSGYFLFCGEYFVELFEWYFYVDFLSLFIDGIDVFIDFDMLIWYMLVKCVGECFFNVCVV